MDELKSWGISFSTLKDSFNSIKVKGLLLTQEEQSSFTSGATSLRSKLKQLSNTNQGNIPNSEIARREVLIINLENAIRDSNINKYALRNAGPGQGNMHEHVANSEAINPLGLSGGGLLQVSKSKVEQQDKVILEIGSGVERIHQQALQIGNEANSQNALLQNLDENVEGGAEELREEAYHAEQVRRKSKTCHLYLCIAAEVAILVTLLMVYINHKNT
jgi:hypothetical protein